MLISSTRSVLHGVILPLLSTMILCLAKSWPWILPSTQRGKSRTQQRSRAAVLSLNSMWMVSEPGDNRNWVHSWLLQTWVWMWLLNVYREMFTFQMKQFCKILRESTVTPWCGFVKEWEAEAVSEVCTLVPKAFFPNVLAVRRRGCRFISVSTVSLRTSLLLFLGKVHSASMLFRCSLLQSGPFVL